MSEHVIVIGSGFGGLASALRRRAEVPRPRHVV